MPAANLPQAADPSDLRDIRKGGFLVLGGAPPLVPDAAETWSTPSSDYVGIIFLGKVNQADLATSVEAASDPAVPIADFGDNKTLRRDFVGSHVDSSSIQGIKQAFAPIWRRLSELPFKAAHESREELTILRLAYSRDAPISARFAPESNLLVEYPMLGDAAGLRNRLEMLASLDLLRRRHFTRTHCCIKCRSARLHIYEACPECGGANLREESLVHHYRCGWQEVESNFTRGDLLVCPKCHRTLRHFGVDYGKPGKAAICATCGSANSEPLVRFACLDCATVMGADDAPATDWYHYDLSEEGVRALRQGRLPQFDIAPLLEGRTRTYSPREFRLLAMHELRVAERFNRPFSVARITILNLESLMREQGAMAADAGFRRVADAVIAELRSSDFVGIGTRLSTVIGFPGTAAKDIHVIEKRIRRAIEVNVTAHVELGVEMAEGQAIVEMLSKE